MRLLLPFPDAVPLARRLATQHRARVGSIEWHRFPDQESLITVHGDCAEHDVVIVCSLCAPDTRTVPLYFAAMTARELGARSVGLVAPYLGYMRQDHRFDAGQALSAQCYAKLWCGVFDWLAAVDPHLHRVPDLGALYSIPTRVISAMPAISEWIREHIARPVIIGPDAESEQWVAPVAAALDAPAIVLEKIRHGDRDVRVSALDASRLRGRQPVVLDDIAASGQTMLEVLKQLAALQALPATCIAVHCLLADSAAETLRKAGAARIVSTNTVPHATNAIDIGPTISAALADWSTL